MSDPPPPGHFVLARVENKELLNGIIKYYLENSITFTVSENPHLLVTKASEEYPMEDVSGNSIEQILTEAGQSRNQEPFRYHIGSGVAPQPVAGQSRNQEPFRYHSGSRVAPQPVAGQSRNQEPSRCLIGSGVAPQPVVGQGRNQEPFRYHIGSGVAPQPVAGQSRNQEPSRCLIGSGVAPQPVLGQGRNQEPFRYHSGSRVAPQPVAGQSRNQEPSRCFIGSGVAPQPVAPLTVESVCQTFNVPPDIMVEARSLYDVVLTVVRAKHNDPPFDANAVIAAAVVVAVKKMPEPRKIDVDKQEVRLFVGAKQNAFERAWNIAAEKHRKRHGPNRRKN